MRSPSSSDEPSDGESSPASYEQLTIVTGLPRSGTSLTMQMLAAGGLPSLTDGVRGADEDNPRGYLEFEPVKRTRHDSSWLALARGRAVKAVYRLLYDFPSDRSYRVLLVRRDLDEVMASQAAMLRRAGGEEVATPDPQLRRAFEVELAGFESWIGEQTHFEWLQVEHRGLIRQPRDEAMRIDRFLGGGLDVDAMVAVVDPALYRNRSPSRRTR